MKLQQNCLHEMWLVREASLRSGCCCLWRSEHPKSACDASPACSTRPACPQEGCSVCQARPWARGVVWDAASHPAQRLRSSRSWRKTRGRLGHHYSCLCSDFINNFNFCGIVRSGKVSFTCHVECGRNYTCYYGCCFTELLCFGTHEFSVWKIITRNILLAN